jgi:hypothetical protein
VRLECDPIRHAPERGGFDLGLALVARETIDPSERVARALLRQMGGLQQNEVEPVMRAGDTWQRAGNGQAREQKTLAP